MHPLEQSPDLGEGGQTLHGDPLPSLLPHRAFPSTHHGACVCVSAETPVLSASGYLHPALRRRLAEVLPTDLGLKGGMKIELCAAVQDVIPKARWG